MVRIIVPEYLTHVELSKSRLPKYYFWDGKTIAHKTARTKTVHLPERFLSSKMISYPNKINPYYLKAQYVLAAIVKGKIRPLTELIVTPDFTIEMARKYVTENFHLTKSKLGSLRFIIYDLKNNRPLLRNPKAAGTPKLTVINGQYLYSMNMHHQTRDKIIREIKENFSKHIRMYDKAALLKLASSPPVKVEFIFYEPVGNGNWDINNKSYFYVKAITDYLSEEFFEDDNITVMSSMSPTFVENTYDERRYLIVQITPIDPDLEYYIRNVIFINPRQQ